MSREVGGLKKQFQIYNRYMCFWKIMLNFTFWAGKRCFSINSLKSTAQAKQIKQRTQSKQSKVSKQASKLIKAQAQPA